MATSVVEAYPNGDRYEGQVGADGAKSGWGKYNFANGKVYEGHWANGKMNGWGEFVEGESRDRFVGEWEDANRKFGVYYYSNGDMYQGGFEKSMKHGRGIIWENKVMYEATYSRDKLVSKIPWKVKMAESSSPVRHATAARSQSPPRSSAELDSARDRISDLEMKNDAQETQLLILTKELKSLQIENARLKESGAGGGKRPSRVSTATTPRARSTRRATTPKGGTRGQSTGPDRTSSVVYKRKPQNAANGFEAKNANQLREEFRYYFNHFDEK